MTMSLRLPQILRHSLALLALLFLLTGCDPDETKQILINPQFTQLKALVEDAAAIGPISISIDESAQYDGAYAERSTKRIFLTRGLVDGFLNGTYNLNHMLFVVCHEIGHISPAGAIVAGTADGEIYADYYSILLLDEMKTDGLNIDIYEAIKYFLIRPSKGGELHAPSIVRYGYLKAKLDYWKAHEGQTS